MYLYCVRHGESTFNAMSRIQGQADPPLSDLGRQQAAALAQVLVQREITAVIASPQQRALQTAQIVAAAAGLQVTTDPRLKEIHVGVFQGKTWAEVDAELPREAERWRSNDPDFVIPGGESRRQLMARAHEVFREFRQQLQRQGAQRVAVISHGGTLAAAFKALLRLPAECNPFSLLNAAICTLQWPDNREDRIKLLSLNDVEHLRSILPDRPGGDL